MGGSAACGKQKPEEKHKKNEKVAEREQKTAQCGKNRKAMFNYCLYKMEMHKKVKSYNCCKDWEVKYLELEYYSLTFFLCSIHSKLE